MTAIHRSTNHPAAFWPGVVMRKWFNMVAKESDYSSDAQEDDDDGSDTEVDTQIQDSLPRSRRRKSETFRAQYISAKELKIRALTWNVGGKLPPDDLDIEDWLGIRDPSDIYVIGFQEVIPLNAGNIFGADDIRAVPKWENIIRETLTKIQPTKTKFKCYSDPSSPSRFKPADDAPHLEDEILLVSDGEEEIYPLSEESDFDEVSDGPIAGQKVFPSADGSSPISDTNLAIPLSRRLTEALSVTERIGLSWPEPPLDLLAQFVLERPNSCRPNNSFKSSTYINTFNSFKSSLIFNKRVQPEPASLAVIDIESLINRKRRSQYVRIVSKQMVGLFLTIWVRKSLRRHIQNVNVSTVGVGVMGYMGNKGSISVSMSIYQTLFCFICVHLTSGEKEAEAIKRNADVQEIHLRTHFKSFPSIRLPKRIHDHERIIWLGDLNYRINLPYEKTQHLIRIKGWSKLVESDQLVREFRRSRAFDGWSEGTLNFPPTYKYEFNSEKYCGEDPKIGRRTPAWCDRVLSFGKGMRLMTYKTTDIRISDHRPVIASYMAEVEVFCPRKLQKALTLTDAETKASEVVSNIGLGGSVSRLSLGEGRVGIELNAVQVLVHRIGFIANYLSILLLARDPNSVLRGEVNPVPFDKGSLNWENLALEKACKARDEEREEKVVMVQTVYLTEA